jgi:hypothetical protein
MASFGSSEIGRNGNMAYPTLAADVARAVERINWLEVAHANERDRADRIVIENRRLLGRCGDYQREKDYLLALDEKRYRHIKRLCNLLDACSPSIKGALKAKIDAALYPPIRKPGLPKTGVPRKCKIKAKGAAP